MQKNFIHYTLFPLIALNTSAYARDVPASPACLTNDKANQDTINNKARLNYHFQTTIKGQQQSGPGGTFYLNVRNSPKNSAALEVIKLITVF